MILSKCYTQYVSKFGKTSSGHRTGKSQSSSQFPRRAVFKECSNHQTTAFISHAHKVMLKILHSRLQHYVNQELPDIQSGFGKNRGTRDQIANIGSQRKQGNARKTSTSISLTVLKPLTVGCAGLCPTLCDPMGCSLPGSSVHGDSPCKNIRMGSFAFLQGIFPIQESNQCLLHCRQILYQLSYQRSPKHISKHFIWRKMFSYGLGENEAIRQNRAIYTTNRCRLPG